MIAWGIGLIVLGLILAVIGFGAGGLVQWIGWILLGVGIILAIIHAIGRAGTHHH